jgi:hypothetical protein
LSDFEKYKELVFHLTRDGKGRQVFLTANIHKSGELESGFTVIGQVKDEAGMVSGTNFKYQSSSRATCKNNSLIIEDETSTSDGNRTQSTNKYFINGQGKLVFKSQASLNNGSPEEFTVICDRKR